MKVKAADYLIIEERGKTHLVIAQADGNQDGVTVLFDKHRFDPDKMREDEIEAQQIVLNLGPTPRCGTVYGCRVEPYSHSVETDSWGEIRFFRQMDKTEQGALRKALKFVYADLQKRASIDFLPLIAIEIRHKQGKYAGTYNYRSDVGDTMVLMPEFFEPGYLREILYHECGHGIFHRLVDPELQAQWIKLFCSTVKLGSYPKQKVVAAYDYLKDQELIEDCYDALEEDEEAATIFELCLDYVRGSYGLKNRDINTLLSRGLFDESYWPSHEMDSYDQDLPVGDYAGKSYSESFAECFRLFMIGHKVPKAWAQLMQKTLTSVK